MQIEFRAPGKYTIGSFIIKIIIYYHCIITGEHSVVYGKDCLAFAIDLKTTCRLE